MPEIVRLDESIVQQTEPIWEGPCSDHAQGGISQSLIGDWLACRERFRVYVIEGLTLPDSFSAPLEFGNYFHCAEEAYSKRLHKDDVFTNQDTSDWVRALKGYCISLCNKYPFSRDEIRHWYMIALAIFPKYVAWWEEHHDLSSRVPLLSEQSFKMPYTLPSGRTVYLRGKWDSVDLIQEGPEAGIWLMEHKTKSSIDGQKLLGQLQFDLQTSVYLIALQVFQGDALGEWGNAIRGVRYNVIKRPAHKSVESMLKSLSENVTAGRADEWFWRRNAQVSERDIAKFKQQCLDPVLENICDDYEWWARCYDSAVSPYNYKRRAEEFKYHINRHFRLPYGTYNQITEVWGGFGDVDNYLNTGSKAGLVQVTELFPELKEEMNGAASESNLTTVAIKEGPQNASN